MAKVLLYLESETDRLESMTHWAADLLEALSAPNKRGSNERLEFCVVADAIDCVELALAFLGRSDAITIEGGERRPSGLSLYPVRSTQPTADSGLVESLEECTQDLRTFGLIDGVSEPFRSFDDAIRTALNQPSWTKIILLASRQRLDRLQQILSLPPAVIHPQLDETFYAVASEYVEHGEGTDSEEYRSWEREAVVQALEFEALLLAVDEPR